MSSRYYILLPIIMSLTIILPLFTLLAYAQKNVTINPNCGTEEGFEVTLETDGFEPNSNVHWDLVDTINNTIALSGYFTTNSSGGFEERTYVSDINSGDYKIKFFDDADTNDKLDTNKTGISLDFSIPCKNK